MPNLLPNALDLADSGVDDKPDVAPYAYGSRGPEGLDDFTAKFGFYKRSDDD